MEKDTSMLALFVLFCGLILRGNCSPVQTVLSDSELAHYFGKSDASDYELVSVNKNQIDDTEQYNFKAFGRDLSMILHRVDGFFSSSEHQCHYEGKLVDGSEASIAISTCNGLSGYISVDGDDYFIAKLTNAHAIKVVGVEDPHIIFKGSPSGASCTVQSDSSFSERKNVAKRKRRAIDTGSVPAFVELNVYLDETMHEFYGNKTANETLSVLNQVRQLFKDKSLGSNIKLTVQNLIVFEETQIGLDATDDVDTYLSNFCHWQENLGNPDVSLLITRLNLQSGGNTGVTGQATDIGSACQPASRCAIAEDHSPGGLVFTITHEIGHALGIRHDGELSSCKDSGNIMSPSSPRGKNAYKWSSCSMADFSDFLSSSSCLYNKPTSKSSYNPTEWVLPGSKHDATQQCQDVFQGTNAEVAASVKNTEAVCTQLLCDTEQGTDIPTEVPALAGTRCARYGVCLEGWCLHIRNTRQCTGSSCPGQWQESNWGTCVNCMQERLVACTRVEIDGSITVLTDITQCPPEIPPDTQACNCDLAECNSACGTTTTTYMYRVGSYGICTSNCGLSTQSRTVVCVNDQNNTVPASNCQNAGLVMPPSTQNCLNYDNCQYQSGAFGACSVTCGAGTMTRSVSCVNIGTSTTVDSANCVAAGLTQPSTTQPCNPAVCTTSYLFVTSTYMCSVTCGTGVETRTVSCATSSTFQIVDDQLCLDAGLAKPESERICTLSDCPALVYNFVTGDFGECSLTCGGGVQSRNVACVTISTNQVVALENCVNAGLELPSSTAECNTQNCPSYAYLTGNWMDCSVTCGSGLESRPTPCITLGTSNVIVDDSFCVAAGLTQPDTVRVCETGVVCPTRYVYSVGTFTQCSTTCGAGMQVRSVQCTDTLNNNAVVDDSFCTGTRPDSTMDCDLGMCPAGMYQYITNAWSACDCDGSQTRTVLCIQVMGGTLLSATDSDCQNAGIVKPPVSQSCTPPSTCSNPVWSTGDFSACSVTCGVGEQTRIVFCVNSPVSGTVVDDSNCDASSKPSTSQACDTAVSCPSMYMYLSTTWTACSVTCGEGMETRIVTCYEISGNFMQVDDAFCAGMVRPASSRPCSGLPPCAGVWVSTDWSQCSTTCGVGSQDRSINCYRTKLANELLNVAECTDPRPPVTRVCYLGDCPLLPGCGETIQAVVGGSYVFSSPGFPANYPNDYVCDTLMTTTEGRIEVTFSEFNVEECVNCSCDILTITDVSSNENTQYCGIPEVPFTVTSTGSTLLANFVSDESLTRRGYTATVRVIPTGGIQYVPGTFGECSVTCGEGVRSRSVTCYNDGVEVDDAVCVGIERPPATEACVLEDCRPSDFCGNDTTVRTVSGGRITPPNFPDPYEANLECINIIRAPINNIINFNFIFFEVEDSENCTKDSVTFTEEGAEDVVYCGSRSGTMFTSTTNEVNITLVTDGDTENIGYIIEYTFSQLQVNQCGDILLEPGQVFSPNYPGNYDNNEDCTTTIFASSRCIEINFDQIEIENSEDCGKDYLEVSDLQHSFLSQKICGSQSDLTFNSFSQTVSLKFVSDGDVTDVGYNGDLEFVDCPQFLYSIGPFSDCSVSCGGGVRTRTVQCVNNQNTVLNNIFCGEAPPSSEECGQEDCPSCDVMITDTGSGPYRFESPNYPHAYNNNDNCTYTIVSPNGECIVITDTFFDLESPDGNGQCTNDFVEVFDIGFPTITQVDCGSARSEYVFRSLSSQVEQRFITNDNVTAFGFVTFVSFVPCPTYAYLPGEWSDCSATCGEGERTRTVICWFLLGSLAVDESLCNDERPPTSEVCFREACQSCDAMITSEELFTNRAEGEDTYDKNQDCIYTVVAPDDMCVTLVVFSYTFEQPTDGVCVADYFILTDTSDLSLNQTLCGSAGGTIVNFPTASNTAIVTFHSDDENEYAGFSIIADFHECPVYIYRTTAFGDCDRTCGNGIKTRSIYCVRVSTGETVGNSNCEGTQAPPLTQSCNLGDCPECDEMFMTEGILSMANYEPNLNCRAEIVVAEGQCVQLTEIIFGLPDPVDGECTDSLEVFDVGNDAPGIEVCGDDFTGFTSRSNRVDVRFVSNNDSESGLYTILIATIDCPTYGFVPGQYDDCTRSCGGGTQTRTVECQELETEMVVDDSLCTDAKPEESQDCNEFDCPPCGDVVDTVNMRFYDPAGSNADYENLQDCTYTIISDTGTCPVLFFSTFELQEPDSNGNCLDYVQINQPGFDNTFYQFCGSQPNLYFPTSSQEVTLTFYSDESIVAEGFEALNIFSPCPNFAYAIGDFGPCSVTCGEGFQVRQLLCIDVSDNSEVDMSECEGLDNLPVQVNETCTLEVCPGCDSTKIITEPGNFEFRFEDNNECETNLTATDDQCLVVFINNFNLPADCEENYIEYYDANAPWLNGKICSDSVSPITFVSQTSTVILEAVSDGSASASDGFDYILSPNDCPTYGFVVSEQSTCSVTCGEGILTRSYECQNLGTGVVVDNSNCQGNVPSSTATCELDDCPSCDMYINSTTTIQVSNYVNNEDCTYTISLESCFTVLSLIFNLEPADNNGQCLDYLSFYDQSEPELNRTFCGVERVQWTSASNQGIIKFISNENVTGDGFTLFIAPVDTCAQYAYSVGDWSVCPCGSGESEQTRVVTCVQISDGSEVSDDMCSGTTPDNTQSCQAEPCDGCFEEYVVSADDATNIDITPEEYLNNIDCLYNITTDEGSCMTFIILSFQLEDSENCENDFFQILSEGTDWKLCGSVPIGTAIQTRSSEAHIIFRTNNNVTSEGVQLIISQSDCPEYGFVAGEFGECSLPCGGGVRTRTVECQRVQSPNIGEVQNDEELCTDQKPEESEACNVDECPVCLMEYNVNEIIRTDPFANNTDCFYRTITNADKCVGIGINNLKLADPDDDGNCTTDYLQIRDLNNTEFSFIYCGGISSFQLTLSSSNYVEVLIHVEDGNGKEANFIFLELDCGTYEQSITDFGECSKTCDGGGERTREVECLNTEDDTVVNDFYCYDLEQIDETVSCGDDPCPVCGGDVITAESGVLTADNDCAYILNTEPDCALITIDEFDVPDGTPGNCEDYLSLFGGVGVTYDLCADNLTNVQFAANIAITTVSFSTDGDNVIGSGYSLRFERQPCPQYEFTVGEYGNCSVECEGGVRTRIVECRDNDGDVVGDNNCVGIKPKTEEECNNDPCSQAFYEYVAGNYGDCEEFTVGLCFEVRTVTCQNNVTDMVVDDSLCTGTKPTASQQCTCPVMTTMSPNIVTSATNAPVITTVAPVITTIAGMTTAVSGCGGAFGETPTEGSFSSPNYDSDYPPDITCVWNFTVPAGMRVVFNIQTFDVEAPTSGNSCTDQNSDYIEITDSGSDASPLRLCIIPAFPATFTSAADGSDFSQFTFRSNSAVQGTGFFVTYDYKI
ncbi:uncharacterized protein LOC117124937 [Anneissia japonica]|uniref:uncharacterized protein LOC117124937 n=1 Tax=Anneissia japonica TaxID=1529436 RepID=UPI001425AC4A|nr:uncharacterized protein LOC117124937 [Anneissia japonica]